MELALGTVQFGLAYGAVGSGRQVEPDTARAILAQAWTDGVRWLDTAAAYGDIESRLAGLCGEHDFRIVSKIASLAALPVDTREAALRSSIARSIDRLGTRLDTLMFHSPADLAGDTGAALWQAARAATRPHGLRLGVSVYGPQELAALRERFDIDVAQLPGNALDQRLAAPGAASALDGIELHLRSAFLQGLLLAPGAGAQRIPAAAPALQAWEQRCAEAGLALPVAALGVVKALPQVSCCVVGTETLQQWQQIHAAWQQATPLRWPDLACDDPDTIDPRRWPPAAA